MTVKELKDCFPQFKLKTKISVPDDREILLSDIEEGKIFQKFIIRENMQNIVDGFGVYDDEICYFYTAVDSIDIETDDFFPPCGGKQEISVYAYYSIRIRHTNGNDEEYTVGRSFVNAIIKLDNPVFTYEKPYITNEVANNSNNNIEVNINASYYYKGTKYEAVKHVIQYINSISSWSVEEEPTQSIFVSLSENEVSNKGGIVFAKVERIFSRIFYRKDSCGNKVAGKSEPGLIEDITNKCLITSSNRKAFNVNKNVITVAKQEVGAQARESKITARFLDKSDTVTLYQKEGGIVTYVQELTFDDETKNKFIGLKSSLPTEINVGIISKEHKYIDGEYVSSETTNDIKIESYSDWVYGLLNEEEGNIIVRITEANFDKENDREAEITIINKKDPDTHIKLIVSQPSLDIVKEEYHGEFISEGTYTVEEFGKTEFYFHPYKLLIYEDGETETSEIEDYITAKYGFYSTNDKLLNIKTIYKKNNNYYVIFNNLTSHSINDILLYIKLSLYNNENKVYESDKAKITVKAAQIIDYNYELCFDGHNKFTEMSWTDSKEPKVINVNSLKHKLVNGKYAGNEKTPFKIGIYDNNGKEYFDDNFSIKIIDNEVIVFPIKTDKEISNTYTITQKETGDKISFNLSYKKKKIKKVNLKVLVYSDEIGKDVWTGNDGYLLIDGKEKIKLVPCWLYPNMKDNVDTAYNGTIEIEEGNHTFETFNVICLEYNSKTHRDCNIKEEIYVADTTENITLNIKI